MNLYSACSQAPPLLVRCEKYLSKDEIERMKAEAERYAKQDEEAKSRLDKINKIDTTVYNVEKFVEDYKDKTDILTEDDKNYFSDKVKELSEIKNGDLTNADNLIEEVNKRLATVGAKVYANVNNAQSGGSNPFGGFDASQFGDIFSGFNGGTKTETQTAQPTSDAEDIQDAK